MGKGKRAFSDQKPARRYFFRKSTMNDRSASDGLARQLDETSRFKLLLKSLQLRRLSRRAAKTDRLKKPVAEQTAEHKKTCEDTPAASSFKPRPAPASSTVTSASTQQPTATAGTSASVTKDVKIVRFAKFATIIPTPSVATSTSTHSIGKRTRKVMSKGARRKLRQQQIEAQRQSSGDDTDNDDECLTKMSELLTDDEDPKEQEVLKERQAEQNEANKPPKMVPQSSQRTPQTAQKQPSASPSTSSAAAVPRTQPNDNVTVYRPLIKFVDRPATGQWTTQVSFWNGKKYLSQSPAVDSDDDSTDYDGCP